VTSSFRWPIALCVSALLFAISASAATGLIAGAVLGMIGVGPAPQVTRRAASALLKLSIVGLGAGMNLVTVMRVGMSGLLVTVVSISVVLGLGAALSRWLRVGAGVGLLVTVGTAICGGSAIAATAATVRSRDEDVSVGLAVVFLLNAVALIVFPVVGHALGFDAGQFGLWSALAIHDTSSVVGAAAQFGPDSLDLATTTKLARALWIVPVTLALGAVIRRRQSGGGAPVSIPRPWFILGFVAVAAATTWVPHLAEPGTVVAAVARRLFAVALLFVGLGFTRTTMRHVSARPFALGVVLWIAIAFASAIAIRSGVIAV
jgi:uncharacterized integral membrane protein (TIGR00698 family)